MEKFCKNSNDYQKFKMKKLKSILTIFTVYFLFTACDKPEPVCITECNNGGNLNSECRCDCLPGFMGSNCATPVFVPTVPPIPVQECELQGTGEVSFKNNSASGNSHDIFWDGILIVNDLHP